LSLLYPIILPEVKFTPEKITSSKTEGQTAFCIGAFLTCSEQLRICSKRCLGIVPVFLRKLLIISGKDGQCFCIVTSEGFDEMQRIITITTVLAFRAEFKEVLFWIQKTSVLSSTAVRSQGPEEMHLSSGYFGREMEYSQTMTQATL
jgi:hypothetical protein